ncbi:hypothetical protein Q7P37_005252 [Cladosporium fusiforme]
MALAIGKRKRRQDVSNDANKNASDSDDDATARALFQRAFEKKFKPLEKVEKPAEEDIPTSDDEDDDDDDDDDDEDSGSDSGESNEDEDFSGFSGDEDELPAKETKPQIEVIEDRIFRRTDPAEEKRLKKQFMSAKIPSSTESKYPIPHKPSTTAATTADDTEDNLQNDLALQRLLKESHLLDPTTFSASGTASSAPEGAARLRALDMRIRDLGGKKSHMDQERMPIAFRKGMVAKASEREDKRRTEAKENGIILERFGAKSSAGSAGPSRGGRGGGGKDRKRAIGTGGPDIGTFRGATLKLSKNDIRGIEGSGKRGGKGGRGGRGGKKKGGMNFGSGF